MQRQYNVENTLSIGDILDRLWRRDIVNLNAAFDINVKYYYDVYRSIKDNNYVTYLSLK